MNNFSTIYDNLIKNSDEFRKFVECVSAMTTEELLLLCEVDKSVISSPAA